MEIEYRIPKIYFDKEFFVEGVDGMPILNPKYRIFIVKGGRAGSKSHTMNDFLVVSSIIKKLRILNLREIQNSIDDSVLQLQADKIAEKKLDKYFSVQRNVIKCKNGSTFKYKGLLRNLNSIKSKEGFDIAFIEEGESISQESFDKLIPTMRKKGSKLIIAYNPEREDAPVVKLSERPDALTIHVNYTDNPFCPEESKNDAEICKNLYPDKYGWVWLGEYREESDAQVFKDKYVVDFFEPPENTQFYFGLDFGFNPDPTAFVRCYKGDNYKGKPGKFLFIDYEICELKLFPTDIHKRVKEIPDWDKAEIRADSSRNDSIAIVQQELPWLTGAKKGAGSVENGIEFLLSFDKIIIHSRCKHTLEEFKLYSYEVDRLSGKILRKLKDKHNHIIDSLRYATESLWNNKEMRVIDVRGIFK